MFLKGKQKACLMPDSSHFYALKPEKGVKKPATEAGF
jgi:hypothetical protein